jgi:MSHA type pilus biogenesis protein MshL
MLLMRMTRLCLLGRFAFIISLLMLGSCSTTHKSDVMAQDMIKPEMKKGKENELPPRKVHLEVSDRLVFPGNTSTAPVASTAPLYSFQARNLEIKDALSLFANVYKLNIVSDKGVTGKISVSFHDLPFDQAMEAILGSLGYYWKRDGGLIRVRYVEERIFTINYLRMIRSDHSTHEASVSSSSSGGSSSGGSSGSGASGSGGSSFSIEHKDEISFWKELETQLKEMTSKADYARVIVNKMTGTIQVIDSHDHVEMIAKFINKLNSAIKRQIDIEVQIVEVTLNKDYSLGIDWNALDASLRGLAFNITTGNIITTSIAGLPARAPSISAKIGYNANNGKKFTSIINAMKEQGSVNIVSKPHIRTLNNQPALIKVGTDRTFFSRKTVTTSSVGATTNNVNDTPLVITEGIVLSITPQISDDDWVIMDVSPVLTRVTSLSQTFDNNGTVLSTAPNVDVRQSNSLVRVRDGQTIILGGLIQSIASNNNRKVPGLGDVPGVGNAFRGEYDSQQKKELVIFMTPHIIGLNDIVKEASL